MDVGLGESKYLPVELFSRDLVPGDFTLIFTKPKTRGLRVHKVILVNRSSFFRELLRTNPASRAVDLTKMQMDFDMGKQLVRLLYGRVVTSVPANRIDEFFRMMQVFRLECWVEFNSASPDDQLTKVYKIFGKIGISEDCAKNAVGQFHQLLQANQNLNNAANRELQRMMNSD